ncbi:MAG TPA: peptide chain release factor N(5)-glutamine methyltransferase [Thermomonas sp.]|nr:peptide chain release factor N(5)-glutamine methyltransferase [Thermomonas sp.]
MSAAPTTLANLLRDAAATIDRIDAEWLLAHVMGQPRSWLFAHAADPVSPEVAVSFAALLARRQAGVPVAYLTGMQGFWTMALEVSPATLIPRPETELLVELALARIPPDAASPIADLGTGSGAIALAVAKERPRAAVIATDASPAALEVARRNATRNRIANVEFREGDWFAPLKGETFGLIASNPPYIADGDPHLGEGDLRFEPPTALSSGVDGLGAIRRIVCDAPAHLVPGGWLLLEHGWDQGEAVRALLQAAGFIDVETARDLEGRDRASLGRKGR